jgi:hypothetical protein
MMVKPKTSTATIMNIAVSGEDKRALRLGRAPLDSPDEPDNALPEVELPDEAELSPDDEFTS